MVAALLVGTVIALAGAVQGLVGLVLIGIFLLSVIAFMVELLRFHSYKVDVDILAKQDASRRRTYAQRERLGYVAEIGVSQNDERTHDEDGQTDDDDRSRSLHLWTPSWELDTVPIVWR
jgi:hypothetical protein